MMTCNEFSCRQRTYKKHVNQHFSTPYLVQNKSFNIKERAHKAYVRAVKDTGKTYINTLMKKVKVA